MTERDWLYVTEKWTVYGVIDPISRILTYVGITNRSVHKRIVQHRNDKDSAIRWLLDDLQEAGHEVEYCVLGYAPSQQAARHLEDALITVLPHLFNKTKYKEQDIFWMPHANTFRWFD